VFEDSPIEGAPSTHIKRRNTALGRELCEESSLAEITPREMLEDKCVIATSGISAILSSTSISTITQTKAAATKLLVNLCGSAISYKGDFYG
jgi:hypothetical protein